MVTTTGWPTAGTGAATGATDGLPPWLQHTLAVLEVAVVVAVVVAACVWLDRRPRGPRPRRDEAAPRVPPRSR